MRQLRPPAVYVTQRAAADARCVARMGRMLTRIDAPRVREITDEELAQLIQDDGWDGSRRLSGNERTRDSPIVFNRFRWDDIDETGKATVSMPGPGHGQFYGFGPWSRRSRSGNRNTNNIVCQSAYELHTIRGCLFSCQYCYFEYVTNIMLDIEEFADRTMALAARLPQTLHKYDSHSDILAFEPEYGASAMLTEAFGRQDRAYLMHYTKSNNVDCLIGAKHNGMSIVCWTLSSHTVSREVERDTATMEERIEAGRRCQEDGYHVRFRFSPVFPIKGWREEYTECLELLLGKVRPDVISILALSRLPDCDMIPRLFDVDLIDPRFLAAAEAARDEVGGKLYGPLPHAAREEIYRFMIDEIRRISPDTPVSTCLETPEMWNALGDEMRMADDDYVCCCGPMSTPGEPRLCTSSPFNTAT